MLDPSHQPSEDLILLALFGSLDVICNASPTANTFHQMMFMPNIRYERGILYTLINQVIDMVLATLVGDEY